MPDTPARSNQSHLLRVEAARYALLRRMAFAMRHQMVVHLQPIGMVTEVIERRLRAPEPDLAQVHEGMAKINGFSRAAVQSCLDVITWMAPDPRAVVRLDAGVQECMGLLRSNFSFRGVALVGEPGELPVMVGRNAVRTVLPACLFALMDEIASPAELRVAGEAAEGEGVLQLSIQPSTGTPGFGGDAPYRPLAWDEVEALARDDGVELTRSPAGVRLAFPAG